MTIRMDNDLALLEEQQQAMLSDLTQLVAANTSFPPGNNYPAMVDLLERLTATLGGENEHVVVPEHLWQTDEVFGPRVNLIRTPALGHESLPALSIYFHTDTVPEGDGWTRSPFTLSQEGERLYGRGTADMKGAIAAVLAALRVIKMSGTRLAFRPILLFCTDEEGGLYPGIRYLAEQRLLEGALLNLNGGATPRIWAGCFGSLDLNLRVLGRSAHSGHPSLGINAIEESIAVLQALKKLKNDIQFRISDMPAPPGSSEPLRALLSITSAHGGQKGSSVPGQFNLVLNRRYLPTENPEKVIEEIRDCIEKALLSTKILDYDLNTVGHLPPVVNPDGPYTRRWTEAQARGYDVSSNEFIRFGSSTSSDFGWVQRAGIQHMMLGGLSRPNRNVHGPDEYTTQSDLLGLARSVLLMLSKEFKPDH
jgi:succinyl-diaminopimelate desuccinylase